MSITTKLTKLAKPLVLSALGAGTIGCAMAGMGDTGGTMSGMMGAALMQFASFLSRGPLSGLANRMFDSWYQKPTVTGKLPANHHIEIALQDSWRRTLRNLAEYLVQKGCDEKWLAAFEKSLKHNAEPPVDWPAFSPTVSDPAEALQSLWRGKGEIFEEELRETATKWFTAVANRCGLPVPPVACEAVNDGWDAPAADGAVRRHTLASVWTEFYREHVKGSQPTAFASLFTSLADIVGSQKEILQQLAAHDDASAAAAAKIEADNDALQAKLEEVSDQIHKGNQKILDELAELKTIASRTEIIAVRTETKVDGVVADMADVKAGMAGMKAELLAHIRELTDEIRTKATAPQPRQPGEPERSVSERLDDETAKLSEEDRGLLAYYKRIVRTDPKAAPLDKANVAFFDKQFDEAAALADESAKREEKHLADVEKIRLDVLEQLFESRKLQGQALAATGKFGEAVRVFQNALQKIPRTDMPESWAELQFLLGIVSVEWANRSEGAAVHQRRQQAIAAYNAALEVYTRETLPQDWAMTKNNLAAALYEQAAASDGPDRARLLGEAVQACRDALEVYTRETLPQDWAMTKNNLANALRDQAAASDGPDRARLLDEAVQAYRDALEVYTREAFPQGWAATKNNLAAALQNQASASDGPERVRLLGKAVQACRDALEVYTREALPQDWAMTKNNLAAALQNQAAASDGPDRARLLDEAVQAYRDALEVRTRETLPQGWAMTKYNLAIALADQADASDGPERVRLLREAIACSEEALTVYTKDNFPTQHRVIQNNLSIVRRSLAKAEGE